MNHPGPRPQAIVLPDAQIRLAMQRIEELLVELDRLASVHDDVVVVGDLDFGGRSGQSYRLGIGRLLTDLASQRAALRDQLEQLRTGLARGQVERAARANAIAHWERRMAAYRTHLADNANQAQ